MAFHSVAIKSPYGAGNAVFKSPILSLGDLLVGGPSFDDSDGRKSVAASSFNTEHGSPGKAEDRRRKRRDTESMELEDTPAGTAGDKGLPKKQGLLFHLGEFNNLCFI